MSGAPQQIGPYEVLGELGRGGMGVVYRVRRADLDRDFALKLTLGESAGGSLGTARLQREAQAAARLAGHPGIVGVHDTGTHEGAVYLVMDLVEGRGLDECLRAEPLPPETAARYGAQIARALAHAHAEGVLHRDLKPANILVTGDDVCRVTDFGLAGSRQADPEVTRLTRSGELLGTPAYMPPEQARGETTDVRADVYSLGATLYECLAGLPPVDGPSVFGVVAKVLKGDIPLLRDVAPNCPVPLEAVVMQCLATRREDRYAGMPELAEDLDRFLAGDPVTASSASMLARARKRAQRRPAALIAGAALVVAAAAGGGWWAVAQRTAAGDRTVEAAAEETQQVSLQAEQAGAWRTLTQSSLAPIHLLLRHRFLGRPRGAGTGADEALALTLEQCRAVAARHPRSALPEAWAAFARHLHGDRAALAQLEAAASGAGDPFPAGVLTLAHLADYTAHVQPPMLRITTSGTRLVPPPPSPKGRAARRAVVRAGTAAGALDWSELAHGRELQQLARAAQALGAETAELAEVAELLATTLDDPLLGPIARFLRGVALLAAGRHTDAAAAFEELAAAGWPRAATLANATLQAEAVRRAEAGESPAPWFERALAVLEADTTSQERFRLHNVSKLLMSWAFTEGKAGRRTEIELMERAVVHLRRVVELGGDAEERYSLGNTLYRLGAARKRHRLDGREALAEAVQLMAVARPNDPDPMQTNLARSGAWQELAEDRARHGGDWKTASAEAIRVAEAVVQAHPDQPDAQGGAARAWMGHAVSGKLPPAESEQAYRRAAEHFEAAARLAPQRFEFRSNLAKLLAMQAQEWRRTRRPHVAICDRALTILDELLAGRPGDWRMRRDRAAVRQVRAMRRGNAREILADLTLAIADAKAAVEGSHQHDDPLWLYAQLTAMRAKIRWNAGDIADDDTNACLDAYTAFAQRHPRHPQVHWLMADVRLQSVRNRATRRGSPVPVFRAAMQDYERAIAVTPDEPVLNAAKAALHATLGERERAREYYQRALKLRPGWTQVEQALAGLGK